MFADLLISVLMQVSFDSVWVRVDLNLLLLLHSLLLLWSLVILLPGILYSSISLNHFLLLASSLLLSLTANEEWIHFVDGSSSLLSFLTLPFLPFFLLHNLLLLFAILIFFHEFFLSDLGLHFDHFLYFVHHLLSLLLALLWVLIGKEWDILLIHRVVVDVSEELLKEFSLLEKFLLLVLFHLLGFKGFLDILQFPDDFLLFKELDFLITQFELTCFILILLTFLQFFQVCLLHQLIVFIRLLRVLLELNQSLQISDSLLLSRLPLLRWLADRTMESTQFQLVRFLMDFLVNSPLVFVGSWFCFWRGSCCCFWLCFLFLHHLS